MSAMWMRFRADLRRRVWALVALGVLAGVAGGVVLTAAAGARRTDTALARWVRDSNAADVLANPDNTPGPKWQQVDRLPHVAAVGSLEGIAVEKLVNGQLDTRWFNTLVGGVTDARLFRTVQRERIVDGRLFDPRAVDEVVINEHMVRERGYHVGSRLTLQVFTQPEVDQLLNNGRPKGRAMRFVVAGVMAPLDDVIRPADDPRLGSAILFTPAFVRESRVGVLFAGKYVRLRNGARDLPAFERDVRKLLNAEVNFQETRTTEARVDRAVRPYVFTLWGFAALATIVGGLVVVQTIGRQHRVDAGDDRTLQALGFSRRDLAAVGALRGATIGIVGAVVAVVVAYLASTTMPIGPLRRVEPTPGRHVDVLVFALGALAVFGVATLHGVLVNLHTPQLRRSTRRRDSQVTMPATIATGFRFALDRGRGAAAVPLRSTLLGVTLAIAALVASLTYARGLSHFTSTPRLYGWVWDYQVEPEDATATQVVHALDRVHGISYTQGAYAQLDFGKESVAAIAVAPKAGISTIEVVRGGAPVTDDEIALGAKTMRALGVGVGDTVQIRASGRQYPMRVVGQAVFARFAPYPASDPTGLGTGAVLTLHSLGRFNAGGQVGVGSPFFLVHVHKGSHVDARTLQRALFREEPSAGSVYGAQRPNDVLSYQHLQRTPLLLAGLLVLLGGATTAHLLVTGVRRRRRDLGLLKAIGCTVRQLLSIVLVQSTTLVAITLLVAVPIGIIAGRGAWLLTAHWLGIPAVPIVPVGVVVAVVVVALAAGNLVAFLPGLSAGRVRAAVALRTE